jgi:hypothetical protein
MATSSDVVDISIENIVRETERNPIGQAAQYLNMLIGNNALNEGANTENTSLREDLHAFERALTSQTCKTDSANKRYEELKRKYDEVCDIYISCDIGNILQEISDHDRTRQKLNEERNQRSTSANTAYVCCCCFNVMVKFSFVSLDLSIKLKS